jgi:hypothetical protein
MKKMAELLAISNLLFRHAQNKKNTMIDVNNMRMNATKSLTTPYSTSPTYKTAITIIFEHPEIRFL